MKACFLTFFCTVSLFASKIRPIEFPVSTVQPIENKVYPVAIIGSGAAGIMAAKRGVLNNHEVLLFSGAKKELKRSRGTWVRAVHNIPGLEKYSRTLIELRNEALQDLCQGPFRQNLFLIQDSVFGIEKKEGIFHLTDGSGKKYLAQYVVLATGIMDEQPQVGGSHRPILPYANGQTVAYCLLCDGHRSLGKKTVVIGYCENVADVATLLMDKYSHSNLAILTNGHPLDMSEEALDLLQEKGITILESPITEVLGNRKEKRLWGFRFEDGSVEEAEMAFVCLGIRPNNQLALQLGACVDERGLVISDECGETSVENLFVVGDLRADSMKQIYTAWQQATEVMQLISCCILENK